MKKRSIEVSKTVIQLRRRKFVLIRILIVGPAWVGDMVMAQSLFITLKQLNPTNIIDVVAPEWTLPLLDRMPEVNTSFALPISHGKFEIGKRLKLAKSLKIKQYDQAIVLPNSWKSALIPFLAKIKIRTGFLGEFRVGLLNDSRILNKKHFPQMVQRFVSLAYPKKHKQLNIQFDIPKPKLFVNADNIQNNLNKFNLKKNNQPILALCPGSEFGSSKRWPEEYYAQIAMEKLKAGWQVWLFGSKNDVENCNTIQKLTENHCINLSGKTNLGEAIDLLNEASCVISNDSGLMHIASALNKPLVAVYGSTDPSFTPPLTQHAEIARIQLSCSPCFKRTCPLQHQDCMKQLKPEKIIKHLNNLELQCGF